MAVTLLDCTELVLGDEAWVHEVPSQCTNRVCAGGFAL